MFPLREEMAAKSLRKEQFQMECWASTHFTDKECLILKPNIVIPDEWILVKSKRDGNAYIIDVNNNLPEQVTRLFSKFAEHNAMLWHQRLGHANAKNLNRLDKNEIVCGLPDKYFITFEKCVACAQGKHHRKPHLPKHVNSISQVLQLLHMDLFVPVNTLGINRNSYCLVAIDIVPLALLSSETELCKMLRGRSYVTPKFRLSFGPRRST